MIKKEWFCAVWLEVPRVLPSLWEKLRQRFFFLQTADSKSSTSFFSHKLRQGSAFFLRPPTLSRHHHLFSEIYTGNLFFFKPPTPSRHYDFQIFTKGFSFSWNHLHTVKIGSSEDYILRLEEIVVFSQLWLGITDTIFTMWASILWLCNVAMWPDGLSSFMKLENISS